MCSLIKSYSTVFKNHQTTAHNDLYSSSDSKETEEDALINLDLFLEGPWLRLSGFVSLKH